MSFTQAWWGLLPGASGCRGQGAVMGAGTERGQGVRLRERHGLCQPQVLLPTHSPRTLSLSHPANRVHFVCGIMCDPSLIHNHKLCSTEAWELPRSRPRPHTHTFPKVLTRCWWDGPGAHGRDREALGIPRVGDKEPFNYKENSLNAVLHRGGKICQAEGQGLSHPDRFWDSL